MSCIIKFSISARIWPYHCDYEINHETKCLQLYMYIHILVTNGTLAVKTEVSCKKINKRNVCTKKFYFKDGRYHYYLCKFTIDWKCLLSVSLDKDILICNCEQHRNTDDKRLFKTYKHDTKYVGCAYAVTANGTWFFVEAQIVLFFYILGWDAIIKIPNCDICYQI